MSYEVKLSDRSFEAMIYAARTRMERGHGEIAKYERIAARLDRAYPLVGVETIRFPHTHLNELLDVMILALLSMNKTIGGYYTLSEPCKQRRSLANQKRELVKYLESDAITRLAGLTK
jgi:hypothetical protein